MVNDSRFGSTRKPTPWVSSSVVVIDFERAFGESLNRGGILMVKSDGMRSRKEEIG